MKKLLSSAIQGLAVAAAFWSSASVQGSTITNDLVVHLAFDGSLADDSGRGNSATAAGSLGYSSGIIGSALAYETLANGTAFNYATFGTPADLNFGSSTSFSVSFWVNFTNNTDDLPFLANKDWSSASNPGWAIAMQDDGTWTWNFTGGDATSQPVTYTDSTIVRDGTWHHLAVTFNRTGNGSAFVDGKLANQTSIAASTGVIDTGDPTNIGQDGTGGYTDAGLASAVNAQIDELAIWRRELSALEISRIFSQGQAGVPVTQIQDPTAPFIVTESPVNGATNASPAPTFSATIQDAVTSVQTPSVQLFLDGTAVSSGLSVSKSNATTVVSYFSSTLLAPQSSHSFALVYSDSATPANTYSNYFSFTVANYQNITLPAPTYLETFDGTAQGQLPAGWSVLNYSDSVDAGLNLNDPRSDSFLNWVVISTATLQNIQAAGYWQNSGRELVAPLQVVNGALVTNLLSTNFLYAECESRLGNSIQYVFSPDFNLTGKANVYLSFDSVYEQSENNIGAIEYSTDLGNTWQPVVYMLPSDRVLLTKTGSIDASNTFTAFYQDLPIYTDPTTQNSVGGTFGSFIAAPISQALSPFISSRTADEVAAYNKVEQFRVAGADGQATVRFRIAQAGSGSWYFGVDNFGIYSSGAVSPINITSFSVQGNSAVISWSGGSGPYHVQTSPQLASPVWTDATVTSQTTATLSANAAQGFYRIVGE